MLKNIPDILSPELLKVLMEMGHSDEIVIADGNFPSCGIHQKVIRADGHGVPELLEAVLSLMPLDQYDQNHFALMKVVDGDDYVPEIWLQYEKILHAQSCESFISHIERFKFYERAKKAYAVIATGEKALYANIILKKGVVINK